MSLYNKLFGENEDATILLGMISCTRDAFMRYRDVYLNKEGTIITVVTRLGGGNRKDYKPVFTAMRKNENYIRDYDDSYDNTYCYFEFRIPEKYKYTAQQMKPATDRLSVGDMFNKEIEEANDPNSLAAKRMQEIADALMKNLESGNTFISF